MKFSQKSSLIVFTLIELKNKEDFHSEKIFFSLSLLLLDCKQLATNTSIHLVIKKSKLQFMYRLLKISGQSFTRDHP